MRARTEAVLVHIHNCTSITIIANYINRDTEPKYMYLYTSVTLLQVLWRSHTFINNACCPTLNLGRSFSKCSSLKEEKTADEMISSSSKTAEVCWDIPLDCRRLFRQVSMMNLDLTCGRMACRSLHTREQT